VTTLRHVSHSPEAPRVKGSNYLVGSYYRCVEVGVKTLRIPVDDQEYEELQRYKGKKSWKKFLFEMLETYKKVHEKETIPKESLRDVYISLATTLKLLGSKMKVVEDGYEISQEYEYAAFLPLYVAGGELSLDERQRLGLTIINVLESILKDLAEENRDLRELQLELRWIIQGLRMLILNRKDLYELSMDNFVEERSRRQGTSTD